MSYSPCPPSLTVNLHGLSLTFQTSDGPLIQRFAHVYGHLPHLDHPETDIHITWELVLGSVAPKPPSEMAVISADDLVSHYQRGQQIAVRLPKYALVTLDLATQRLYGQVTQRCLDTYGVFEDVMMMTLAPLYRRRGWFPLHAFAAQAPNGKAALLTGDIGAGKTTTGLALLDAGWKLLSNDSPLLATRNNRLEVLAYPGQLSAFDDSLYRFERLKRFIPASNKASSALKEKRVFRAEDAFSQPWATSSPAGGLFFPKVISNLNQSQLTPLPAKEALLTIMPQMIESWDKAAIGQAFHLLRALVAQVPSYILELAPDVEQLPRLIEQGMDVVYEQRA